MIRIYYPYIDIWIDLNSVLTFIADSHSHFEHWMACITGLLRCKQYRHQCQRELIVELQITQYEFEPGTDEEEGQLNLLTEFYSSNDINIKESYTPDHKTH